MKKTLIYSGLLEQEILKWAEQNVVPTARASNGRTNSGPQTGPLPGPIENSGFKVYKGD